MCVFPKKRKVAIVQIIQVKVMSCAVFVNLCFYTETIFTFKLKVLTIPANYFFFYISFL